MPVIILHVTFLYSSGNMSLRLTWTSLVPQCSSNYSGVAHRHHLIHFVLPAPKCGRAHELRRFRQGTPFSPLISGNIVRTLPLRSVNLNAKIKETS